MMDELPGDDEYHSFYFYFPAFSNVRVGVKFH